MDRNSNVVYLMATVLRIIVSTIARIKYGKKPVWLVCERGTDARDNGYHMFRYLRKEHPEIEAWYVISPDSEDLKKVADLGNIAFRGSLQHWMLFSRATRVLTAFEPQFIPSGNKKFADDVIKKNNQKIVFLQHGIIGVDLPLYHQEQAKFDLFVCGAKPEYDYVSSHFNYTHNEVRYTGLARFDALQNNNVKRQILIMPTWRNWLYGKDEHEVAQSKYVQSWNRLLNHPLLAEFAENNNVEVIFFPHSKMQKYVGLFSSGSSKIVIADAHNYDVQPLLKESAMLVTDYSSVHFDFAYMKKPVVYYQFNEEKSFSEHNPKGYFDYPTMGFGERVEEEDELINLIKEYIVSGFSLKPEFEQRIEGFFPLHDDKNCERIYQEIVKTFGDK